jgi:small subunit ribosomal protein S8
MSVTDPIADMLNRIRNACAAQLPVAVVTHSRTKEQIAGILKREGFIRDFAVEAAGAGKALRLVLKYTGSKQPVIKGLKRVSTPGLRRYVGTADVPKVLDGMGLVILSTPAGVLTDSEARQRHVGGEVLLYVW